MSLEKLAKTLYVDEVMINHGSKGVAVHVRIEQRWHSAAIDNDKLGKGNHRLEVIADHLLHLADGHIHKIRDLRKSQADYATRAALQAEADAVRRLSWVLTRPVPTDTQFQVMRYEAPSLDPMPPAPPSEPAVSESMPSRFHAIMAELKCL